MENLFVRCQICETKKPIFSKYLGICPECIRSNPEKAIELSDASLRKARRVWNLPTRVPRGDEAIKCHRCTNECMITLGNFGYCGIWKNENGKLKSIAGKNNALLHTYLDPLPTNCCSTYFCPGGSSHGYPKYSYSNDAEYGYYNLACFLYGCNFFCLGCQNDQHRQLKIAEKYSLDKFATKVQKNPKISCICWFGGSPEPQLTWALRASKKVVTMAEKRIMRICWEWNGAGNKKYVENAVKLSLETGGNAKFDIKYFNPFLSLLFSGVSNKRTFENFERCYDSFYYQRNDPVLTATTLLIPGYVNDVEVREIAKFIANLDENIPYSLLVFHPDSFLSDLPITSRQQVNECYSSAKKYLKNVHIGNRHLLV